MKPEIKKLWTDALRSGEYSQARGYLNLIGEGYCCLGVLCEVAIKQGLAIEITERGNVDDDERHVEYDYAAQFPPDSVLEWAGLEEGDPDVRVKDEDAGDEELTISLSELNDGWEYEFFKIAALIDAQL